jgi:hypothetical protein
MDKIIIKKITEKIFESLDDKERINQIINALGISNSKDIEKGIIIGRVYNSFHYQTRRLFKRDPTQEEFLEFLNFLKNKKTNIDSI